MKPMCRVESCESEVIQKFVDGIDKFRMKGKQRNRRIWEQILGMKVKLEIPQLMYKCSCESPLSSVHLVRFLANLYSHGSKRRTDLMSSRCNSEIGLDSELRLKDVFHVTEVTLDGLFPDTCYTIVNSNPHIVRICHHINFSSVRPATIYSSCGSKERIIRVLADFVPSSTRI